MSILKKILFAVSIIVSVVLIFLGIGVEDILEVITNGSILCLSCVGIG